MELVMIALIVLAIVSCIVSAYMVYDGVHFENGQLWGKPRDFTVTDDRGNVIYRGK